MARDLLDASSSESADSETGEGDLKINQAFAERFEHNKKREELQKLEEKYGKTTSSRHKADGDRTQSDLNSIDDSSSDSEDEDDAGVLATVALDSEILATLNALKSKDPRVYDGKSTFYTEAQPNQLSADSKNEKPMFLRDYHRENLLNGSHEAETETIKSYDQRQKDLKDAIVDEMKVAIQESDSDDDGELFIARKSKVPTPEVPTLDVVNADKDPETFLSNFLTSRAWVPDEKSTWQQLESDDEEEEEKADAFEQAYNMRFEDPNKSNETLRTHARDLATKYSVRREEKNARKRKREAQREKREAESELSRQETARLKKLRVEEVEAKIRKIKKAAGLKSTDIQPEDWSRFVDEEWDDAKWEHEMQQRFGEAYYAEEDIGSDEETNDKKKKIKRPKFEDDIDINDIVPDFEEDAVQFDLSGEENPRKKPNAKKAREEKKRDAKRERRIIEQLVDDELQLNLNNSVPGKVAAFRYRETSPQSFGLNSREILMAEDSQLNQFAGLKKLAAFRDSEKKRKDRKHLGKRARLRQWRKETFGNEDGLQDEDIDPKSVAPTKMGKTTSETGIKTKHP